MQKQAGLFDLQFRLEDLSRSGDPLVELDRVIEWERFVPMLQAARAKDCASRGVVGRAGRRPFPPLLMFKALVLQGLNNLSDDQTEYMIKDRLSYMRFLGLSMEDPVPDAKTIWHYRETFVRTGALERLFRKFDSMLCAKGYSARRGTIVDATIVNASVQRNTREENTRVRRGEVPEEWKGNPSRLAQKDMDARWGKKHGAYTFGYKAQVATDVKNKLIRNVVTTSAAVHDSNVFGSLVAGTENSSRDVYADSGYVGSSDPLPEGYRGHVCGRGFRGLPLTERQARRNRRISRIRCRGEHPFGRLKCGMRLFVRSVGRVRAAARVLFGALCYNFSRLATLERLKRRELCVRSA